jgi:hypothetical protein
MDIPKYIKSDKGEIIIFNSMFSHKETAAYTQIENPIQAGFIRIGQQGLVCYGSSITLKIGTNSEDALSQYREFYYAIKVFTSGYIMLMAISTQAVYLERMKEQLRCDFTVHAERHPLISSDSEKVSLLMQALPIQFNDLPEAVSETKMQAGILDFFGC